MQFILASCEYVRCGSLVPLMVRRTPAIYACVYVHTYDGLSTVTLVVEIRKIQFNEFSNAI